MALNELEHVLSNYERKLYDLTIAIANHKPKIFDYIQFNYTYLQKVLNAFSLAIICQTKLKLF